MFLLYIFCFFQPVLDQCNKITYFCGFIADCSSAGRKRLYVFAFDEIRFLIIPSLLNLSPSPHNRSKLICFLHPKGLPFSYESYG